MSYLDKEGLQHLYGKLLARLNNKVDKVTGKGLSTNDYTTTEKNKLAGIETGANKYTHPDTHPASMITQDSTHRFVSDTEKSGWDEKANIYFDEMPDDAPDGAVCLIIESS